MQAWFQVGLFTDERIRLMLLGPGSGGVPGWFMIKRSCGCVGGVWF